MNYRSSKTYAEEDILNYIHHDMSKDNILEMVVVDNIHGCCLLIFYARLGSAKYYYQYSP